MDTPNPNTHTHTHTVGHQPNTMKTKIVILLCALAGTVHATLIDLTPDGFSYLDPWPTVVSNFFGQFTLGLHDIAGANIVNNQPVWSPFTIFGDDHFSLTMNAAGTGADVSWDLTGTQYHLRFILAEGSDYLAHLYAVRGQELFAGDGFITIDGSTPLRAGTFAGSNTIPDSGSTLALMASSLLCLFFYFKIK